MRSALAALAVDYTRVVARGGDVASDSLMRRVTIALMLSPVFDDSMSSIPITDKGTAMVMDVLRSELRRICDFQTVREK